MVIILLFLFFSLERVFILLFYIALLVFNFFLACVRVHATRTKKLTNQQ